MRYFRLIIIFAALLFLSNCEKDAEVQPKDYPYVITYLPSVNIEGAEFSADITNIGNYPILKYGFVWSAESNPTIQDNSILFNKNVNKGIYSCNVNSGLANGQTYSVRAYILTDKYEVYGNEKSFSSQGSLPPVINDFEPKFGPIGTKVVIEGKNFALSKTGNTVKFGDVEVIVDSVSENKLVVTIPQITKPEKVQITIETAGMSASSQDSFDLWFPWKKLGTFNVNIYNAASFSHGAKGYVIQSNSNSLLEYSPQTNTFTSHSSLPESSSSSPLAACSVTKAIVLLNNNVYEIDLNSFNWSLITNYTETRTDEVYLFYINNEIFIGSLIDETLFKYNANNNNWVSITASDLHDTYSYSYTTYNNYGYVYFSYFGAGTSVSIFDPSDNSWQYLTSFPFASDYGSCQFNIENNLYAGFGKTSDWGEGYANNQIWEYNLENNKWTRYNDCPQRMHVRLSLTISGKGYAFSSHGQWQYDLNDVWEFDPTKN
jgi:hypothetical protein